MDTSREMNWRLGLIYTHYHVRNRQRLEGAAEHRELSSGLYGHLEGGLQGKGYVHTYIAGSLHYTAETNATLQGNFIPVN